MGQFQRHSDDRLEIANIARESAECQKRHAENPDGALSSQSKEFACISHFGQRTEHFEVFLRFL